MDQDIKVRNPNSSSIKKLNFILEDKMLLSVNLNLSTRKLTYGVKLARLLWVVDLQEDLQHFYGETMFKKKPKMLKFGQLLILEYFWMPKMFNQNNTVIEMGFKIYSNYPTLKQILQHHNACWNTLMKNLNACLLKISTSLSKHHFSRYNPFMIHGLFPIF